MNEILSKVTKEFQPSTEYDADIARIVKQIEESVKNQGNDVVITMGGSYAKKTHIGNSFDCDIFVRFKEPIDISNKLQKALEPVAKELNTRLDLIRGSRDYFQIPYKTIIFEVVPVKYIENVDDAENIMDFSPFHVDWVQKELAKKDLSNDIRLLKQFLKSARVYGAESYIKGFSGHVNDIIILKYRSFEEAIKAISKWTNKKKVVIDYNNDYKGQDVTFFMNEAKVQSPLIVIDPIEKTRNAAAALSEPCFLEAIKKAKEFLKNPSEDFFKIKEINKETLAKKFPKEQIVEIEIKPTEGKKDIVGAKFVKALENFANELNKIGFEITNTDWNWKEGENAHLFLITKSLTTKKEFLQKGPNKDMEQGVKAFMEKHQGKEIIEKDDSYFVKIEREFTNITDAINHISQMEHVKDRIDKIVKID